MNVEIYYPKPEVEILNKLNEITGSRFREIKSNLTKIKSLLKAGFISALRLFFERVILRSTTTRFNR